MDSGSGATDSSAFTPGAFGDVFADSLGEGAATNGLDFAMPEYEHPLTDPIASEPKVVASDAGRTPLLQTAIPATVRHRVSGLTRRRHDTIRVEGKTSTATRPKSHETTHAWTGVILVGGLIAAFALYLAFLEISPMSLDPLGNSLLYFGLSMAALTVCAVALAFAIRGALVGYPKHRPATAIVLAVLVVPLLVFGAGALGLNEAKREVQDSAVSGAGRTFIWVLDLMVEEGVNIGPLDRLLE